MEILILDDDLIPKPKIVVKSWTTRIAIVAVFYVASFHLDGCPGPKEQKILPKMYTTDEMTQDLLPVKR